MKHQSKLLANHNRFGGAFGGAPREGPALLTGLVLCGRCGRRMAPAYSGHRTNYFTYTCGGARDRGQKVCWTVPGEPIDRAVESLLLETVVPEELELCLAVEREVGHQAEALEQQWRARREKATYEARYAERRYKAVDPDNRVVARTLEREWEQRLRELSDVERAYAQAQREHRVELSDDDRAKIRALARDLPAVWRAPTTQPADRKAMLRLVVEAIALSPVDVPKRVTQVRVQWQSGVVTEIAVPRLDRQARSRTPRGAQERIHEMVEKGASDEEIAAQLNAEGAKTGKSKMWNVWAVRWARGRAKITRLPHDCPRDRPVPDRHPDGRYSIAATARRFGVSINVVRRWVKQGFVRGDVERYGAHPFVRWLRVDRATAARLTRAAGSVRRR
jgi:hypothetical protein